MKTKYIISAFGAVILIICIVFIITFSLRAKDARALCEAVENDDMEQFYSLIDSGAYPNGSTHSILLLPIAIVTESDLIKTPLQKACMMGNVEAVACLLEHGASPNKRVTPLDYSCIGYVYATPNGREKRFELIPLLLSYGASPGETGYDNRYSSAVFLEADITHDEDYRATLDLISAMDPDYPQAVNKDGDTLLHELSRRLGGEDSAALFTQHLIEQGANVDAANQYGLTPLMIAAMYGNGSMVQCLIDAGCDRSIINEQTGKTAADYAKDREYWEIVSMLQPA